MYNEIFEEIGLTPNEAKIYETLLYLGETSVSEIAKKGNIHRRNVYDALNRLAEKGLIFRIFQKGENLYRAVAPAKLLEEIEAKEKKLRSILPRLEEIHQSVPTEEAAYIYKGIEGYKNYIRELVYTGEDVYLLGVKALWFTPGAQEYMLAEIKSESKRKKFGYYTLFDPRVKDVLPDAAEKVGGQYKFLPKDMQTPGVVDIYGDMIATFTSVGIGNFGEDGTIFIMKNKELADSYRTWFKFIWNNCDPLNNKL